MTIICYQVLPSAFVFSNNSLILFGFPLTSFPLAEASLSAFLWLYNLLCAVVHKYQEISCIYNYSHPQYSFWNHPVLFTQLERLNKLWNNNHTMHVSKGNQNKKKTKSRHIQIYHAFFCLIQPTNKTMILLKDCFTVKLESRGRFLVNECVLQTITYHSYFFCLPKVSSILHHGSVGRGHSK